MYRSVSKKKYLLADAIGVGIGTLFVFLTNSLRNSFSKSLLLNAAPAFTIIFSHLYTRIVLYSKIKEKKKLHVTLRVNLETAARNPFANTEYLDSIKRKFLEVEFKEIELMESRIKELNESIRELSK